MTSVFVVLPYLRTDEPFTIAETTFRNSHNRDGLTTEESQELDYIQSLFYLTEDDPLDEVLYVLLRMPEDNQKSQTIVEQVRSAHTVLGFLLMNHPHDSYEQLTSYWIVPRMVTQIQEDQEPSFQLVDGYSVTINWQHWIEIPRGSKLFPPLPHPLVYVNPNLQLSDIDSEVIHDPLLFYLYDFIHDKLLYRPEQKARYQTLLRAMAWYAKSFSQFLSGEEEVIHLAIAFEVLFHEAGSKELNPRNELKQHFQGLFGSSHRLNVWIDQFYDERSRILHEGFAAELRFLPQGKLQPNEKRLEMDSLVNYGRRLLRMCIFNILHASSLAENTRLGAWFTHDQEVLELICKELSNNDTVAEERLKHVVKPIYDLEVMWQNYSGQREIKLKTLFAAAKLLIDNYLEAFPATEDDIKQKMENVSKTKRDKPLELHRAYKELSNKLPRGLATYRNFYWPRKPRQAIAHFFNYASSHHISALIHEEMKQEQ